MMLIDREEEEIMNRIKISKNFHLNEFECRHCSTVMLKKDLLEKLQTLRDKLEVPLVIMSAYRCPIHNKAVEGADRSQHLLGTAADISLHTIDLSAEHIAETAEKIGFTGIGFYNTFLHLDVRPWKARWDYRG